MHSEISETEAYTYATKNVIVGVADLTIEQAISMINTNKFRRLPIVDDTELIGIITATDIIKFFVAHRGQKPVSALLAEPLEQIMTKKVIALPCNASIRKAAKLMAQERIGGLPLMSDGQLVGIITERDILALFPQIPSDLSVRDIMTKEVITVSPKKTLFEGMEQMTSAGIRRLPVTLEDGGLLGLVCIHDIFRCLGGLQLKHDQEDVVFGTTLDKIMSTILVCIEANALLSEAASTMAWKGHGALPVTDATGAECRYGQLIGIITERDILGSISKPFGEGT